MRVPELGGEVALPLGVVREEAAVLAVLIRRYCCAVGAAVRQAVDNEVPGAVEEETGPAAVIFGHLTTPTGPTGHRTPMGAFTWTPRGLAGAGFK